MKSSALLLVAVATAVCGGPVDLPRNLPVPPPLPRAAPSIPAPIIPEIPSGFEAAALYCHNFRRAWHESEPMAWSDDLALSAQTSANLCLFDHQFMKIAPENLVGFQSIATSGDSMPDHPAPAICVAVDQWYAEYTNWLANPQSMEYNVQHFRYMTSKDVMSIGCGWNYCPSGIQKYGTDGPRYMLVCNYSSKQAGSQATDIAPAWVGAPTVDQTYTTAWNLVN